MMKKVLLTLSLVYSFNMLAQTQPFAFVCSKDAKQGTVLGVVENYELDGYYYRNIVIDTLITDSLFTAIQNTFPKYKVKYSEEVQAVIRLNGGSQDYYLIQAGRLKNASVAVSGLTTVLTTALSLDGKATEAGVVSILGGGIALGLNIAGNNALIKAGKRSR